MSPAKRTLGALLLLWGALGCQPGEPSQVVEAEFSSINAKADQLNLRITKAEKSLETLTRSTEETEKDSRAGRADLSVAIEDLRTETKTTNGALGILRHDLDEQTRVNQKVKEDFDVRLNEMAQTIATLEQKIGQPQGSAAGKKPRSKADETSRYNQTLALLQKKKAYDTAIEQFRDFLNDYPQSGFAANAQYWIGEAYYAKEDFPRAISEYQVVVDKYPQAEKLCDALLKQGFAFGEMKEPGKAKLFLHEVTDRCPKSPAASKAAERLAKLAPE